MESPVTARAALLQALLRGPGFGGELIGRVRELTEGRINLHQGSIYPALRALEASGLVISNQGERVPPELGGRPRRYYKLTGKGTKAAVALRSVVLSLYRSAGGQEQESL